MKADAPVEAKAYFERALGDFHEVLRLRNRVDRAWEKGPNLRWYVYAR